MKATLPDSSEFSSELRSSIRRRRRQQSEAMYRVTAADDTANGRDCLLVGRTPLVVAKTAKTAKAIRPFARSLDDLSAALRGTNQSQSNGFT